ncbi:MAG: S8 family serine peptidase [Pirellulales bacterium]
MNLIGLMGRRCCRPTGTVIMGLVLVIASVGSTAQGQEQKQGPAHEQGPPSWVQPGRGAPPARVFDRSLTHSAVSGSRQLPAVAKGLGVPTATTFSSADMAEAVFRAGSLPAVPGDSSEPPAPSGDATTGVGGGTFDLNTFLGADRYYGHTTPITGQNTIAFNLEAGHFWNGHETLQHVATTTTNFVNSSDTWGPNPAQRGSIAPLYDRHATWAAMLVGGRQTEVSPQFRQQGLAPGTDLRSGAIATGWSGLAYALSFGISGDSYIAAYTGSFASADVVNSSYGYTDPGGTGAFTLFTDAMSFQSPGTLHVVSAGNDGNDGPGANTVGAPGSGYNTLTVAALDNANTFASVAGFSSRGPQDFAYFSSGEIISIPGVRAAVDLAAPGTSITSAFYGGQAGGNNSSLIGSTDQGSDANAYTDFINGTSFAAPIVAGGAALVASAAKTLPALSGNPDAAQSVVVKALLLNGADKTSGWNNGQQAVNVGGTTAIVTTQSLDWAAGAGRMNLDTTFDLQVNGQTDVPGTGTGNLGAVVKTGWDYGNSLVGVSNDYPISEWLRGGTSFTTSLTWMRAREWDDVKDDLFEIAQANLNLSVWELNEANHLTTLIARSESLYNTVEHLSFTLPRSGFFGLRVEYPGNTFDNTTGQVWGTAVAPQDYAVSWQAVPEPGTLTLVAAAGAAALAAIWRRGV